MKIIKITRSEWQVLKSTFDISQFLKITETLRAVIISMNSKVYADLQEHVEEVNFKIVELN